MEETHTNPLTPHAQGGGHVPEHVFQEGGEIQCHFLPPIRFVRGPPKLYGAGLRQGRCGRRLPIVLQQKGAPAHERKKRNQHEI
mmetsp:Transcript_18079/g.20887  ORF Transcript_18079/g.20887 Transcript_18079/m.20887 type:complete len:84 (+) Transcript_18079:19-270(+)